MKIALTHLALALLLALPGQAFSENKASELASKLAGLRNEVESLSSDLRSLEEEEGAKLHSLAEQRADLDLQINREKLRSEQAEAALNRLKDKVGDQNAIDEQLKPVVLEAIKNLKSSIHEGLPFRVEDRIAELDLLTKQVENGTLRYQEAANRLWLFIEDELRLTRESGMYRQTVKIGNDERLVDIARIGMVSLYFETNDNRYGRAVRGNNGWQYQIFSDSGDQQEVARLFDSFKKQLRVGFFELPNALPGEGAVK